MKASKLRKDSFMKITYSMKRNETVSSRSLVGPTLFLQTIFHQTQQSIEKTRNVSSKQDCFSVP